MTLKIKTFRAQHLRDLQLASFQLETLGVLDQRYGRLLEQNCSVAQSLYDGPRVLACWGLLPLWSGVSEAWMLVSDNIQSGRMMLIRGLSQVLDGALEHRIQTSVLTTFEKGIKFVAYLGFEAEGIMKRYDCLGRDHIRFARVKHG